jgi:hypothetical protein
LNATLNSTSLALSGTNASNAAFNNSISLTDATRISQIATTNGAILYRVYAEPSDFSPPPSNNPQLRVANDLGEGEGPSVDANVTADKQASTQISRETTPAVNRRATMASSQAQDAAIAQVSSSSQVISEAGDFIATQQATGRDRVDTQAVNSVFSRFRSLLR